MSVLTIIGAGGHGKVAADCALQLQRYDKVQFLDIQNIGMQNGHWPIVDTPDNFLRYHSAESEFFVAIGNNATRKLWQMRLHQAEVKVATLIHPSATLGLNVVVDEGTLIVANAAVNIDTRIGKGCIVNTGASVDHDCVVGDFVHIAPGSHLAGNVTLHQQTFVGIGSAVVQGITIGENCQIGAGATVLNDIEPGVTAVGTPACKLDK